MPAVDQIIKQNIFSVLKTGGEALLSATYPDNFELYIIALEVRDDKAPIPVLDFFVFPVNPDSVMRIQKTLVNVKKSFSGVHVMDNETFIPFPISLNGTFGRKMRYIYGKGIKTGFGSIKSLQEAIELGKSKNATGYPNRLILHLLPFGESYTVVVHECRYNQSFDRNRIWSYDLNLTAVAPAFQTGSDITTNIITSAIITKAATSVLNTTMSLISSNG